MSTGTKTRRVTITAPTTRAPSRISVLFEVPCSASTMCGSWRPTSANSSALMTKVRISHIAAPCSRLCTDVSAGVRQPR
jgi:hypothetical protein